MFQITTHTDKYNRVSESALALCRTPTRAQVGTSERWAALPHRKLWARLIEQLAYNGYPLVDSPEIFVNPDGLDVIGGMKVRGLNKYSVTLPDGREVTGGYSHSIVFGNNNGGAGSLRLAAGAQVWICDNGCIQGEYRIRRKHTTGLDWRDAVDSFCLDLDRRFERQRNRIERMIATPVTNEQAAHWLIERRRVARIPAGMLDRAWDFWRRPPHEEFLARNHWSLYNAVTESAKGHSLRAQTRALELA